MDPSRSQARNADRLALRALLLALVCAAAPAGAQTLVTNPAPFLTTNLLTGPRSERLNIVVLGDGYTAAQASLFQTHVTNIVLNHLFTVEPFRSYRAYHNVFSITTASLQSGADHPSTSTVKDTYFDATYDTSGIARLVTLKQSSRATSLRNQFVPEYDYTIVIVNDSTYGGSGSANYAITSIESTAPQIAVHELGHSFANLADEYEDFTPGYSPSEKPNCTTQTNRATTKWAAWIESSTPILTPETSAWDAYAGLFTGCMYTNAGWYRPHNNSAMRTLGRPMGQINADQIIKCFYQRGANHIDPFRNFAPSGTNIAVSGLQMLPFSVQPMKPDFHSLAVSWSVDGVVQPGQTGTNWSVSTAALGLGQHVVSCTVSDPTTQVRIHTNATFPTDPLRKTAQWNVTVQSLDVPSITITNPVTGASFPLSNSVQVAACAFASNGISKVEFFANGAKFGEATATPYKASWTPSGCGSHTFTARAIATLGETNMSAPVAITLAEPPPPPWQAWRSSCFSSNELACQTISGETADPDGDGVANLLEYAFHRDPAANDGPPLSATCIVNGRLTLTYTKAVSASDLVYTPEVADKLTGPWQSGPSYISEELVGQDTETQTMRASDLSPISSKPTRFLRLRVSRP